LPDLDDVESGTKGRPPKLTTDRSVADRLGDRVLVEGKARLLVAVDAAPGPVEVGDYGDAIGPRHAMDLVEDTGRILDVLQGAVRASPVDAVVLQGQRGRVAFQDLDPRHVRDQVHVGDRLRQSAKSSIAGRRTTCCIAAGAGSRTASYGRVVHFSPC
jgi:hypothetical protein